MHTYNTTSNEKKSSKYLRRFQMGKRADSRLAVVAWADAAGDSDAEEEEEETEEELVEDVEEEVNDRDEGGAVSLRSKLCSFSALLTFL